MPSYPPHRLSPSNALTQRCFQAPDRVLADYLKSEWGEENDWIGLAAALCSQSVRDGHTYLDLSQKPDELELPPNRWPNLPQWLQWLEQSPAATSNLATPNKPLVFTETGALYLEKYYTFENRLCKLIVQLAQDRAGGDVSDAKPIPSDPATAAAQSRFFVITGGPGTGKTTLSLQYLNRLLDKWDAPLPPRFAAVAPTGKAAARLAESIASGIDRLDLSPNHRAALQKIPCLTLHRLLGVLPHRTRFRHDLQNPIHYDAIVVDECSMIDLPLMLRFLEAVPPDCKVLLLGDKDQLSSVEVGSVFSDLISAASDSHSWLAKKITKLTETYRFKGDSSIYRICQYTRLSEADKLSALLEETPDDFRFHPISPTAKQIPSAALTYAVDHWRALANAADPEEALRQLNRSIVLTPTKTGAFGARAFNQQVLARIRRDRQAEHARNEDLPPGVPIIVLENNYELNVFNGDLGIVWDQCAYFPTSSEKSKAVRLSELPRYEPAFALTIHKSQGSEFDQAITLVDPSHNCRLNRELLYTAFSRAKQRLFVFGDRDAITSAAMKKASRATRLATLLTAQPATEAGSSS